MGLAAPGGSRKALAYDGRGSTISNTVADVAGNEIMRQGYERNALGNLTAKRADTGEAVYAYDGFDQLTNSIYALGGDPVPRTFAYAYDPIGNRLSAAASATTNLYSANHLNQYTNILLQPTAYSLQPLHDLNGNLTNDGFRAYTWDIENRLLSVTPLDPTNGALSCSFAYDHLSRRTRKTVSIWDSSSSQYQVSSHHIFFYDGWNLISEVRSQASEVSTNLYTWGLDLSGTLQGAGGIGGLLAISTRNEEPGTKNLFPCYDHNGNVEKLTDAAGAVVAQYVYSPFGETLSATGPAALANPFRFSTRYSDEEMGLVYYIFRYYSPEMGRWLSREPAGEAFGPGLYTQVGNNPLTRIDVLGLYAFDMHYLATYYMLRAAGIPENRAWVTAYFSAMPDIDPNYNATSFRNLFSTVVGGRFTRFVYMFLHQLNGLGGQDLEAMRCCLREGYRNATDPRVQGFLLHALADSYGHFEMDRREPDDGGGDDLYFGNFVPGTRTYRGRWGHARDEFRPDVAAYRPELATTCLSDIYAVAGGRDVAHTDAAGDVIASLPSVLGPGQTDRDLQRQAYGTWAAAVARDWPLPAIPADVVNYIPDNNRYAEELPAGVSQNDVRRLTREEVRAMIRQVRACLERHGVIL
ncbi:MAG: RHS repeat-associated core domain-containing protein [Kiritimatiellae bacterium]|nr:RHS repeat-associated core domain-containing protein [Kiritimatiellia bacterium]